MAGWDNDDLILYHGCTEQSLRPSNRKGIALGTLSHCVNLTSGGLRTEFGQGFYATTWFEQAKSWANIRAKKLAAKSSGKSCAESGGFALRRKSG